MFLLVWSPSRIQWTFLWCLWSQMQRERNEMESTTSRRHSPAQQHIITQLTGTVIHTQDCTQQPTVFTLTQDWIIFVWRVVKTVWLKEFKLQSGSGPSKIHLDQDNPWIRKFAVISGVLRDKIDFLFSMTMSKTKQPAAKCSTKFY